MIDEFPGGDPVAQFKWTYEEMVLAADLAARNGWRALPPRRPELAELSELLRLAAIHPREGRPQNFRSPDSVRYKVANLVSANPNYPSQGVRVTHGEKAVVAEFLREPSAMRSKALAIRTLILRDLNVAND